MERILQYLMRIKSNKSKRHKVAKCFIFIFFSNSDWMCENFDYAENEPDSPFSRSPPFADHLHNLNMSL